MLSPVRTAAVLTQTLQSARDLPFGLVPQPVRPDRSAEQAGRTEGSAVNPSGLAAQATRFGEQRASPLFVIIALLRLARALSSAG